MTGEDTSRVRRPTDLPTISDVLAWLAWFAALLAGLSAAADAFAAKQPPRPRREEEPDVIDVDAVPKGARVKP